MTVALGNNTGENFLRVFAPDDLITYSWLPCINNIFIINRLGGNRFSPPGRTWHINCRNLIEGHSMVAVSEKRILVIDSSAKVRRDLETFLKNENYYIETGRRLTEAIKKISQGYFDCLILDVDLPEMKGYEAVPILKNLDPKIKIIMTAGKNTKRLEAKVRAQDIFFYFIKSFGKDELKLAIENAFNESRRTNP
ncbi:MAG: response regulator [Candidatus Aminicenantes bacterium]|nr:response regulator [Candidatus Aminicenantes bacterium]